MMYNLSEDGLIRALDSLDKKHGDEFDSETQFNDYAKYYTEVYASLAQYASENKHTYILEKLKEMPSLKPGELRRERSDFIGDAINFLANVFHTSNAQPTLHEKLEIISSTASNIAFVLRNPAMLDMLKSAENKQ